MNITRRTFLAAASLLLLGTTGAAVTQAQEWKPAPAPLMTRWAKDVSPDRVRPEYPRPQFVRKDWKSLNGLWEFAFDDKNEGMSAGWSSGKALPERILVPFTYEAALSGIGKGKEVHERVWYRRSFDIPSTWKGKRVHLNFGAVDWETTVWVNGKEVGKHRGGYTPFTFDVTDALKEGGTGPQEVVVAVYDPADPKQGAFQPKGKQLGSEGIWYTRTTGIWQSVWLEPVNSLHIDRASLTPERAGGNAWHINAGVWLPANAGGGGQDPVNLRMEVLFKGQKIAEASADISAGSLNQTVRVGSSNQSMRSDAGTFRYLRLTPLQARLPVVQYWSPERPDLYDVRLTLKRGDTVLDQVTSYTAVREVGMDKGRLTLNGKPYFYRGVLDQGYWPDGILTPPTDEAIRYDVEMTKKLGFNMSRKHVKVEDPRFYYWCDKLGVAVWQDMPSSHNLSSAEGKQNFTQEWTRVIQSLKNHPSIVHWIPFNENWGDPKEFQDEMVLLTRKLDPTRPITDASGWTQRGLTDVIDAHDYGNSLRRQGVENPTKPKVVGEYGGIALPVEGHTWTTGWGYQTARDPEGLLRRIRFQTTQLFEAANLSGFVYTQLTDVEQEMNGLLTYDRLPKADTGRIAAIFEGKSRHEFGGYIRDWLVLGPIETGTRLHSAEDSAENRAVIRKVLDEAHLENEAGLRPTDNLLITSPRGHQLAWHKYRADGDALDFLKVFDGRETNAVVYAVAYLTSPREYKNVILRYGSDDGAKIWLNGETVATVSRIRGVNPDEDEAPGLTLKKGENVLIFKVAQGIGGWGVAARFETADGKPLRDLK